MIFKQRGPGCYRRIRPYMCMLCLLIFCMLSWSLHMLDIAEKRAGLRLWRAGLKGDTYMAIWKWEAPLGKGVCYVSSHAYVMERITVYEVMQWRNSTDEIIADCAQVPHVRWNLQTVKQEHYQSQENFSQMFKVVFFFFPDQALPVHVPLLWYTTRVSQTKSVYLGVCVPYV